MGGKKEDQDQSNYFKTCRREFTEECGDPTGLCKLLDVPVRDEEPEPDNKDGEKKEVEIPSSCGRVKPCFYKDAKMAVVFCEVPLDLAGNVPRRAGKVLRPVWARAEDLRRVLA